MRKLAILITSLAACAGVDKRLDKRASILEQVDEFFTDGLFQVVVECQIDQPDGKTRIERGLGNAFLVYENTLASVAHLFRDTMEKKCTVVVRNHKTADTEAKIKILDTIFDVAILEAKVKGTPFKLRDHKDSDDIVYVSGLWFYRQKDKLYGTYFLVRAMIDKSVNDAPLLPLRGMFAHGMSGSAVIAPDGQVIGVFAKVGAGRSPSAKGRAAWTKHIIDNLNFYRNEMRGGKNEKK